jgi:hypothetical protein
MEAEDGQAEAHILGAAFYQPATAEDDSDRVVVWINGSSRGATVWVPDARLSRDQQDADIADRELRLDFPQ